MKSTRTSPAGPATLATWNRHVACGIGHHSTASVHTFNRPWTAHLGFWPNRSGVVPIGTPATPGIVALTEARTPRGAETRASSTTPAGSRKLNVVSPRPPERWRTIVVAGARAARARPPLAPPPPTIN